MNPKKFLTSLSEQLVEELRPTAAIDTFTTNPDVIGAFAEARVRDLVTRLATPLHVCTGAVISPELCRQPRQVPQIDTILWSPAPAPAAFAASGFGLVPRGSVFGILEIKRSDYRSGVRSMLERLNPDNLKALTADICHGCKPVDGSRSSLAPAGLGVICVADTQLPTRALATAIADGRVVILLRKHRKELRPCPDSVLRLVNFIAACRDRAAAGSFNQRANVDLVKPA